MSSRPTYPACHTDVGLKPARAGRRRRRPDRHQACPGQDNHACLRLLHPCRSGRRTSTDETTYTYDHDDRPTNVAEPLGETMTARRIMALLRPFLTILSVTEALMFRGVAFFSAFVVADAVSVIATRAHASIYDRLATRLAFAAIPRSGRRPYRVVETLYCPRES